MSKISTDNDFDVKKIRSKKSLEFKGFDELRNKKYK